MSASADATDEGSTDDLALVEEDGEDEGEEEDGEEEGKDATRQPYAPSAGGVLAATSTKDDDARIAFALSLSCTPPASHAQASHAPASEVVSTQAGGTYLGGTASSAVDRRTLQSMGASGAQGAYELADDIELREAIALSLLTPSINEVEH